MDITIKDLAVDAVDNFISTNTERYGRITRKPSTFNDTVDLLMNVKGICITENAVNITFPDNSILFVKVPSDHYHKIEVM